MIKKFPLQFFLTLIVFLLLNTSYFWEGIFGVGAFIPIFIIFCLVFILFIEFVRQFYISIRDRFSDTKRNFLISFMLIFFLLIYFKPLGIVNFEKLKGEDALVANREGAANCMTTLRLKKNKKFTYQSVCFGIERNFGNYTIKNDTIFFKSDSREFKFQFAKIKNVTSTKGNDFEAIILFENKSDKKPLEIYITKNDLNQNSVK